MLSHQTTLCVWISKVWPHMLRLSCVTSVMDPKILCSHYYGIHYCLNYFIFIHTSNTPISFSSTTLYLVFCDKPKIFIISVASYIDIMKLVQFSRFQHINSFVPSRQICHTCLISNSDILNYSSGYSTYWT